ncbi:hypothetical protein MBLNU13_g04521t1 [Cladosporium sp. NU13]
MSTLGAQITGILSGAFLTENQTESVESNNPPPITGAMTSLSIISVPVLLDTATDSPQLLRQWSRMYHYGHLIMPSMAAGTLLLHACSALQLRAVGKPWGIFACAGAVTIAIAPFTWTVMGETNGKLFERFERVGASKENAASDLRETKGLVKHWSWLHLMRSLLPLAGTALAVVGTFGDM